LWKNIDIKKYRKKVLGKFFFCGAENSYIPLYINMSSVNKPQQIVVKSLESNNFDSETIRQLQKESKIPVLLLLDGYDEIRSHIDLLSSIDYNKWTDNDKFKIILTSRPLSVPIKDIQNEMNNNNKHKKNR